MKLRRSLAVVFVVAFLAGCASTPVDRWYQAASGVAAVNDTVADLYDIGVLEQADITGDPDDPEDQGIKPWLDTMNGSLDRAKARLPEGGDAFEAMMDTMLEARQHLTRYLEDK